MGGHGLRRVGRLQDVGFEKDALAPKVGEVGRIAGLADGGLDGCLIVIGATDYGYGGFHDCHRIRSGRLWQGRRLACWNFDGTSS